RRLAREGRAAARAARARGRAVPRRARRHARGVGAGGRLALFCDLEDELAGVLAAEELEQRVRERVDAAFGDLLAGRQLALGAPLGHLACGVGVACGVVEDEEAL